MLVYHEIRACLRTSDYFSDACNWISQMVTLAVTIPSAPVTEATEPWQRPMGDYKMITGDNMQFCQNFDG